MDLQIENYKDKHEYISENGIRSVVYLMDCMEGLKQIPEKYFELTICDPPYGIDADQKRGDTGRNGHIKQRDYHIGNWDKGIPTPEYFEQLKRVSKNQIIWGGNYFLDYLGNTSCFIVWDKDNGDNYYADCELAWTSFDANTCKIKYDPLAKGDYKGKIHPTQKPIALYEWVIKNYAKPNDKILDTHLGSQSSRIAACKANLPFMGFELDEDYFKASVKRYEQYVAQKSLF